jgi:hypothetical protein
MRAALLAFTFLTPAHAPASDSGIQVKDAEEYIQIETDVLQAKIRKKGYVSGIAAGSMIDKKTGAKDAGFGLHIMDFLMGPGWKDDDYARDKKVHGALPKHYIEGPQICTQAKELKPEVIRGKDFVAVRMSFKFTKPAQGYKAGSLWEQTLVFQPGKRYILSSETITSVNDADNLFYRIDMPGHIKHKDGDSFTEIFLSYKPTNLIKSIDPQSANKYVKGIQIPARAFTTSFGPDEQFLYQRKEKQIPERMIRAYRVKVNGQPGPWLAGMTLDPAAVSEAWCHQRGYVCFIQELHGKRVKAGDKFGAAYVVGYFNDIADMDKTYDHYRGTTAIMVDKRTFTLKK